MPLNPQIPLSGNPVQPIDLGALQQQALQVRGMQEQAAARTQKVKEDADAKQAHGQLMDLLKSSLVEDPETGVWDYEENKILPVLGALPPEVAAMLKERRTAVTAAKAAQKDYLARTAAIIDMTGNDPALFEIEMDLAIKNGQVNEREATAIRDAVKADPSKIAQITAALTGKTPAKPGDGDFTLGQARYRPGESTPYAVAPPNAPAPYTLNPGDKRFDADNREVASVANRPFAPVRQAAAGSSGGQGGGSTAALSPQAQSVLARVTTGVPSTRVGDIKREAARLAASGDEQALKSYLRYAAVETLGEARKTVMVGRLETIEALSDAEELLRKVPTGFIAGTWEDTARKLGQTSDPRLVELGTMMGSVLANYMRSISGAAIADTEAARLMKLLPNYNNSLPVNLGTMRGLSSSVKSFDEAFYKHKFGENMDWVLGAGGGTSSGGGTPKEGDEREVPGNPGVMAVYRGGKWIVK